MTAQKLTDKRPRWLADADVSGAVQEHFDLTCALGLALIALVFMVVPYLNASGARTVTTGVFMLCVPGYVSIAALFPGRHDIGNAERAALSFALSLGLAALIGFGLNFTPLGIRLAPVGLSLEVLTFVCAWMAALRRAALAKADRFTVRFEIVRNAVNTLLPKPGDSFDRRLTLIMIASLIVSASVFAYLFVTPTGEHFSELYVLGPYGEAKDYPQQFTLGQNKSVFVGVTNMENSEARYQLTVRLNDSGNATTLDTERITLGNGQTWQQPLSLTPDKAGNGMKMEFTLYKEPDLDTPYREVYFWVNVTSL